MQMCDGDNVPVPEKKIVIEKEAAKNEAKKALINKRHEHCKHEANPLKSTLGTTSHHSHHHY